MNTCFPNFEEEIRKGKADLSRKDLCVIIAGETSAGKSTLINRLVGKQIFTPDVSETTSTICRVRNSGNKNQIECKIFGTDNQVLEEKSFPKGFEVSMKEFLQEYVDERPATSSIYIDHVDVSLSVPFLKGNTMIVNTPGIGGSKDLEVKMMEYLPNATSFVFVMSVVSAGGLQEDRLIKILQEVMKLHDDQDIPCFDPRDALFVSNKWDAVHKEQCEKTWRKIQEKLKTCWPSFSSENVFRTALDPP
ncbi:uncharacterized protein LOC134250896 [Saccostrea cucullata]|uniref:uncharacterized protein LOC134250896 n=1 Tax=Saccostrea cuccullata TaxID=36930 RepID=UPI002ED1B3E4